MWSFPLRDRQATSGVHRRARSWASEQALAKIWSAPILSTVKKKNSKGEGKTGIRRWKARISLKRRKGAATREVTEIWETAEVHEPPLLVHCRLRGHWARYSTKENKQRFFFWRRSARRTSSTRKVTRESYPDVRSRVDQEASMWGDFLFEVSSWGFNRLNIVEI